jgi:ribosomal protein L7/L12
MKHMGDVNVVASNKVLIYDWINKIHADHGSPVATAKTPITKATTAMYVLLTGFAGLEKKIPVIKAVMTATAMKLKDAKQTVEASLHAPVNLGTFPAGDAKTVADSLSAAGAYVKLEPAGSPTGASWGSDTFSATPVDAVIDLKNAKAVGQKVHGTSPGSVYYTVALTDHVKLAARLYKTGSISIRAEWTDNPTAELKKLEDSGLQLKMGQSYGSIHFEAAGVPVERVVGAFLFGTGIAWKATVMTGTNLIIAEKA